MLMCTWPCPRFQQICKNCPMVKYF